MKHVVQKLSRKLRTIPTAILANCRKNRDVQQNGQIPSSTKQHKKQPAGPSVPFLFSARSKKAEVSRFPGLGGSSGHGIGASPAHGGARILAGPGSRLQEFNPENPQDFPANISSLWHLGVVRAVNSWIGTNMKAAVRSCPCRFSCGTKSGKSDKEHQNQS